MIPPGTPGTSPTHLDAQRLSFAYPGREGTPFELHEVNASVPRGSITGLLGPNGSGKSTLLRLLAGILPPTGGSVRLGGQRLADLSRRAAARRIAVVPQSTHPAFDFTCREMVLMGRHPHLGAFALEGPDDLAIANDAMRDTDTLSLADRPFATLSGGEQQRVVLAGALAQSPEVLLLDEPTASLDLGYQLEIAGLLTRLNRERQMTMVIATHDLNFAARVCDRLVLLRGGRVLSEGPTSVTLTREAIAALYAVEALVEVNAVTRQLVIVPMRRRE